MPEIIMHGVAESLQKMLQPLLQIGSEGSVMLQRLPQATAAQGEEFTLFGRRRQELDYENWQEGRIFCREYELRWRRLPSGYRLVYTGSRGSELSGLQPADLSPELCEVRDREYELWGVRLDNLERLGIEKPPGLSAFFEVRIPRPLFYPVPGDWYAAALLVREYYSRETGYLAHHRYLGLRQVAAPRGA